MPQNQSIPFHSEAQSITTIDEMIREVAREGARSLLQRTFEVEIANHLQH